MFKRLIVLIKNFYKLRAVKKRARKRDSFIYK